MSDPELNRVAQEICRLDPRGDRIGWVLRRTFDQLYDGQHTGRYRWDQLYKTEKTYCGTLVEINLQREFRFCDGLQMDYLIAGVEVDCKYSQNLYGWMIPPEAVGHLCLLLYADDYKAKWSLGLVRIVEDILNRKSNRDRKKSIAAHGRQDIEWIFRDADLPPNVLLQLPKETVERIMALPSGQKRIDEIFRVAQGRRIGRGVIATLGQQDDFMKRVRGNGGSRSRLKREGIIILGEYVAHRKLARDLGLPEPQQGEFVSIRLARASQPGAGVVKLEGGYWRVATEDDPVIPAPDCRYS